LKSPESKVEVTTIAGDDGVTVTVETIGTEPELVAVKLGISPVPLAAKPIEGVLLVQLNIVPDSELVKTTGAVVTPLQIS
jgi:hypothetical protein